ncbi:Phospholipase A(1) [Bertholletia excelsa]
MAVTATNPIKQGNVTASAFQMLSLSSPSSSRSYSQLPITLKRSSISSGTSASLAVVWRDVQGCNNWQGIVEPLDPLLRHEIVRYGEFVKACYKTFDLDPTSHRYLNCKHGKRNLLREVGLEDSGYEVTKYIYATPPVTTANIINNFNNHKNSNSIPRWIGYVAVSSDQEAVNRLGRRDVLVTFRGTVTNPEWMANLMSSLTPARLDPHNSRPQVKVETGFHSLYTNSDERAAKFGLRSCREQLLSQVSVLLDKYKGEEMSITLAGHSMGKLGLNTRRGGGHSMNVPITVFSFGGPRVGNSSFKQRCEELGIKVLRIVNVNDPITKLPGVFFNENFRFWGDNYAHVGVELQLELEFLKMKNPSCVHDLETYISLLRCPTRSSVRVQSQGANNERPYHYQILNRAKELFYSTTKTF